MSPLSPPQKVYPGKQHISNEPSRCTLSHLSPYSLHNRGPGLSVSNLLILPHTHVMQPPPSITNATQPKIMELPILIFGGMARSARSLSLWGYATSASPITYATSASHRPLGPSRRLAAPRRLLLQRSRSGCMKHGRRRKD